MNTYAWALLLSVALLGRAAPVAAASATDLVSIVSFELQAGISAEARHDGKALMAAALSLERAGAHPAEGETDIARLWQQQAKMLGARMPVRLPFRGRTLGPAYKRGAIAPHAGFQTLQSVNAGENARVNVMSVKGAMLTLDVRDDDNHSVCQPAQSARGVATKVLECRWVPAFTGMNTITLNNTSDFQDTYFIVIN